MGNMLYLAVDKNKLKRRTKFVCKSLGATLTKWPFGASVRSYPSLSRTFKRIEWPCDRCQPVTWRFLSFALFTKGIILNV